MKVGIRKIAARLLLGLLIAVLVPAAGMAAEEGIPAEAQWPALNEEGFTDDGEFAYQGAEEGLWRYCSPTLKVEVIRRTGTLEEENLPEIWYEAEVWTREGENWQSFTAEKGKYISKVAWPADVCAKRGAVLAVNGDYAKARWTTDKKKKYKIGVMIRNGEIMNDTSIKAGSTSFPNLDMLALYPDGNMEVYYNQEITAAELQAAGVKDVFSFGPWLLRDGELNPMLSKLGTSRAPRTAVGMVEKGHYFLMVLEGRHKDSRGGNLSYLAEKMKDKGCTVAFNLDGGETSCVMFMGKQINKVGAVHNNKGYARQGAEFIGFGVSALVEGYDPDAP